MKKSNFIKPYKQFINSVKSSRKPLVATWLSIILNTALFALKIWAGIISNSVALMADAWHTLSDSVSSLAVLVGIKYSQSPADKNHPYGHGRAELIASIVVGVLLAVVGFNFLIESIVKFREKSEGVFGAVAIWVTVTSIIVKEIMARYSLTIGKEYRYNSLIADGWHHRSDAISSVIILLGIFVGNRIWWIDSFLGFLVSLFIFYTTYGIMKDSVSLLIGEGIDKETEKQVVQCGNLVEAQVSLNPHHFKIHHYGNHTELTFHIMLPGYYSLETAHNIASRYERIIEEKMGLTVTIHVDTDDEANNNPELL